MRVRSDLPRARRAAAMTRGPSSPPSPMLALLASTAFLVPALILAYPLIVWPLTEGAGIAPESNFVQVVPSSAPGILNRIYFPPLLVWALVSFLALPRERLRLLLEPALLATGLLLLWMMATSLWALEPVLVLRRTYLQITIVGAIVLSVLAAERTSQILGPLLAVAAAAVAINLVSVLTTPPGPIGHEGIYPTKNFLGAAMGVAIVIGSYHVLFGRWPVRLGVLAMMGLAVVVLLASRSKTSLALAVLAPAIGMALLFASRHLRISPAILMPGFMLACYGTYQIGAQALLWNFASFATAIFGDPTLTNRTDIWAFAVSMIERKPVLGWGYGAFWGYGYDSPAVRNGPGFVANMPHAHNGYLDAMLETGAVGFAILVVLLLLALASTHRLSRQAPTAAAFALSAIVFAIGYNFLESAFFDGFNMISAMLVVAIALAARFREGVR